MAHDTVLQHIRLLKDENGRFLWSAGDGGLSSGPGGLLLNRPVFINQAMPDTLEASAKPVLFGDFRKYKVRRVRQIRICRLVERYAEFDQEAFIAFFRLDSRLLSAGSDPIKHLAMAEE